MDEWIELLDINGNLVRVSLHSALALIGETLRDTGHTRSVTRKDGQRVEVRFEPHTEEVAELARKEERERNIALIEKWRDGQTITQSDMVDHMSFDFTRASANEIIALIREEVF